MQVATHSGSPHDDAAFFQYLASTCIWRSISLGGQWSYKWFCFAAQTSHGTVTSTLKATVSPSTATNTSASVTPSTATQQSDVTDEGPPLGTVLHTLIFEMLPHMYSYTYLVPTGAYQAAKCFLIPHLLVQWLWSVICTMTVTNALR